MIAATGETGASLGALGALPLACLVVDSRGQIAEANPAAIELLGVDERFVVGKLLVSFVAQGGRGPVRRLLLRPESRLLDIELETRRHERLPVRVSAARDGDRLLLVLVDRGREERGETRAAALERSVDRVTAEGQSVEGGGTDNEAWLRVRLGRLVESLPQGVLGIDRRLRVTDANRAAVELFGDAAVQRRRLPRDWHGFDLAAFAESLFVDQALSAEASVSTAHGHELRLIGMASDDRRLAVVLADDVSQRSRREQAERDFVANAAHELQSPIAAVVSAVDALELGAKDVPEDRDRFLRHLARESHRMQGVVRALLALARTQHRGEPPRRENVPLRPFLEDVAARMRPAQGVEVDVLCPAELAVETSVELLGHAIGNAAANAARFTLSGRIRLSALRVSGHVVIDVADTGPGIAHADRGQVLQRFYRSRPATEGAGLGLAIASQAVDAIGGALTVGDAPEGGALVRITLPGGGR